MGFVIDQLTLLGLNGREVRVFTALATFGQMNMTMLAARAGLPRTTVDAIVRRLLTQGLLVSKKVIGHTEYYVELSDVSHKLDSLIKKISPTAVQKNDEIIVNKQSVDFNNLKNLEIFEESDGSRVGILQSRYTTPERLVGYVTRAIARQCVIDLFAHKQALEGLCEILPRGSLVSTRHSFYRIPTMHCSTHADIILFHNKVCFLDPTHEDVESTQSGNVIAAIRNYMNVIKESGWRMDFIR